MSSRLKSEFKRRPLLWLVLTAIAAVYAVSYASFPAYIDNWIFEAFYLEGTGGNSEFSFDAWLHYIWREYHYDNARLAQIVAPIVTLHLNVMKWPVAILLGVGTSGIVALTTRLTCGYLNVKACVMIWLLLTVILPWRNWMVGILYASNYIIPCVFMLYAIYMMRSKASFRLRYMLPSLLIVVWGHESIGLSLACGMLGYIIMQGFKADRRWWSATLFAFLLSLAFVLTAGIAYRINVQINFDISLDKMVLNFYVHFMLYLLIAFYIYCIVSPSRRKSAMLLLHDPVFVVCCASALALTAINLFNDCQSRYGFSVQLTSIIASGIILRNCFALPRTSRRFSNAVASVTCCMLLGFWSLVALYQDRYYKEYRMMLNTIVDNHGGTIAMEFKYLDKSQPWLLNIPMRNLINNQYDIDCLSCRYPAVDHDNVLIVRPDGSKYSHITRMTDD